MKLRLASKVLAVVEEEIEGIEQHPVLSAFGEIGLQL